MKRPGNYVIPPHVHNAVQRGTFYTRGSFIKSGKIRVDFYDDDQKYLESRILFTGDVVLLAYGGHGFEMLEESEILEVKQGPYAGERDKIRFEPVSSDQLIIKSDCSDDFNIFGALIRLVGGLSNCLLSMPLDLGNPTSVHILQFSS